MSMRHVRHVYVYISLGPWRGLIKFCAFHSVEKLTLYLTLGVTQRVEPQTTELTMELTQRVNLALWMTRSWWLVFVVVDWGGEKLTLSSAAFHE